MTKAPDRSRPATRERLLDATAELIAELGWNAVTSRAVAERAGVNNGVVHYHVRAMDTLRRAATSHATDRLMHDALQRSSAAPSATDACATMLSAVTRPDASQAPTAVLLEAMLHAPRDPEVRELIAGMIASFRALLEDGLRSDISAGRVRDGIDVHGTATALAALIDGLMLHAMVDPGMAADRAVTAVTALLAPPDTERT